MSITWEFTVYDPQKNAFFPYGGYYDFTDRLQGFDVKQMAHPGRQGTGEAILRLTNFDGALTPNGSGTYAGVDWASCLFLLAMNTTSDYHEVFAGVLADFVFTDDGVISYVDLVLDDPWAIVGRSITEQGEVTSSSQYLKIHEAISSVANSGTSFNNYANGVRFPNVDKVLGIGQVVDVSTTEATLFYTNNEAEGNIGERIRNGILPASAAVFWPGSYKFRSIYVDYDSYCVGEGLSADTREHTLTETLTGAAGEAVLDTLQTGHNLPEMINKISVTVGSVTGVTPATYNAENIQSTFTYGTRAGTWGNHLQPRSKRATRDAAGNDVVNLDPYLEALTERFANYRFTALTASTKQSQNTTANAETEFGYLCDIRYGIWAPCSVKYTPTGAASQITDVTVITRRRLRGTPSDVTLEMELLPAIDYQSLVLNSDMLGTLDYNRLG